MNTVQEHAVNNFILDYLPPSSNNISIPKPKCIMQLKRRIIRVDALQKHCLTLNHHLSDKSKELEDTLKRLDSTQEDYKQTSLEYQETLENASKIEMENQTLNAKVATLEREHLHAVTQLGASQSHIVQLEQLLIQKDRKIESLEKYDPKNIEKIIEERIGAEIKEKDKEKLLWKKRYERLQKKMKDEESKKKKNKALIQKYEKQSTENNSDCQSFDGHSDNEDNNSVELMSQMIEQQLSQNSTRMMKTSPINLKDRIELDNDNSNEIVSIDTGCGSSLASSDNEKWLNSPDYIFSPIHADNMENFRGRKLITVGTSPILSKNVNDIATSPILSVILNDVGTSPIEPIKMTDVATSPVHTEFVTDICKPEVTIDKDAIKSFIKGPVSSSPLTNNTTETALSLVNILENIETDKQESVNTNKSTAEQLGILNSINDSDMAKMRDRTKDGIIKPVITFDSLTTSDMQMSTIATEHNTIESVNICKDKTSSDSDNNVKPAIKFENLTNPNMQVSMTATQQSPIEPVNIYKDITSPDVDNNVKPAIRFEDLINPDMQMSMTAMQQNLIGPVNICKDITSPDADNNVKPAISFENLTNPDMQMSMTATQQDPIGPVNICKDITSPDADNNVKPAMRFENLTNPDMQMSMTAKQQNPIELVNIYKDITSPDADNNVKPPIRFENLTNKDMQISTTAADQKPIEPVNIFKDITSPDADRDEQETESTTDEIDSNVIEISKNISVTDIQENTNKSKEIEPTSPIAFEENITQIQDIDESSTLVTVEQIKKTEELLNVNSSNNVNVDNGMDTEIEMILKSMRFNRKLITPLPRTPVKTVCQPANKNSRDILVEEITHTLCQEAAIAKDLAGAAREEASSAKEYAAKLREDHIKLLADFNKLQKDMLSIKIMLNSQISLRDNIDLQGYCTVSTLSNNFSSEHLHDRSSKHHNKFSLDQTPEQFSILDDNDSLCDQQELPKVGNNNFKSGHMQSAPLRSRKKTRSGESQDQSTTLGNSDAEILQDSINDINLDILDSQPKLPLENKIKIISDNVIKPTDLEHLKSKKDWENFIQNSQQGVEQQCNKEQHKSLSLKINSFISDEQDKSLDQDTKKRKRNSARKLTSLAKYRRKCEKPVFKIKRETPSLVKFCKKPKQLRVSLRKMTDNDNAATLNDKNIYANAVKIMSELNAKNSNCSAGITTDIEKQIGMGKDKDRAINSSETSPKTRSSHGSSKESDNNIQYSKSSSPPKCTIVTRSRKMSERVNNNTFEGAVNSISERSEKKENILHSPTKNNNKTDQNVNDTPLANRKRKLSDCSDTSSKRVLRNTQNISADVNKTECERDKGYLVISADKNPKESILCVMIQKYGIHSMHYKSRNVEEDEDSMTVCDIIEKFMSELQHLTCKKKRDELVNDLQFYNYKNFIGGLMRYLNNPERKCELFSKMSGLPGQIQITKSESVLMYVIQQLRKYWSSVNLIEAILSNIEYILFRLNQTPIFEIVESMAHFYAVLCRLNDDRDRLITFMLDSMYCILFKSVVLIKQCLEAWPNIIPLAHMSKAKTPLMTCFVYLLHFFKCEDRFNRLPEIRNIMYRKYFYEIKDWNEMKVIDLLKCSIKELRDNEHDKKMLRIAVIVFGKRHGPKWTNNNIIKKILQPFIDNQNTAIYIKVFCIALIGPLFKPYPVEMKVHCDIALDQLISILNTTKSKQIAEAALTSIVLMGRHNFHRVTEVLLSRKLETIDPALEELICDHVRMRTVNTWLRTLPKIGYNCNSANK